MVITISGPHGAGKSTYAKEIAKALNLRYVSSGGIFRKYAKESGCNLEAFSKACEKNMDIDHKIDKITIEEAMKGDVVLDGQLVSWMAKDYSNLSIYVTASMETRIKRIAERDGIDFTKAYKETVARTKSETQRFKRMYKIDISNKDIYDLILSTDRISKQKCTRILIAACTEIMS
ncbi:MAG TPA: AAA family ATPase [candidate division Zixibacteria bacterium]|nr:AAA family ATPase [candidate division Zixibacteria bacterium]